MMCGLCLIPEGRKNKEYSQDQRAEIYKVSNIKDLDKYIDYADQSFLGVLYISVKFGLTFADDYVTQSPVPLYKYNLPQIRLWSKTIAEQIFRECLNQCVSRVYLMITRIGYYDYLIHELKIRGIHVFTPFLE